MKRFWKYLLACFCVFGCAATHETPISSPLESDVKGEPDEGLSAETGTMMIPEDALKTSSGLAYVYLVHGSGIKPDIDAVKVHLRVLDIEGQLKGEESLSIALSHSTPFLEEMLPILDIGSKVRVWGESQDRIWEIEILGVDEAFRAPKDAGEPPEDAQKLKGYDSVRWRIIEPGKGEKAQLNQVFEIYASRWKSSGEILESNRSGKGKIVILNETNTQIDPIHLAILQELNEGAHARLWIPAELAGLDTGIVEDLWVGRHYSELDVPSELSVPTENVTEVEPGGAWIRIERSSGAAKLVENENVEVDMTCWDASNGVLIDAGIFHGRHEIMEIKPQLGVWYKIMQHAAPGDIMMVWIKASALPEQVTMDLTCRVELFDRVE